MSTEQTKSTFEKWLGEYKGIILRIVRAYAATFQDRDDLFQEILMQLWISIPRFGGRAEVSTWIYRVALNTALIWKRSEKKHRRRRKPLLELKETDELNDNHNSSKQIIEQVYSAIRKLPKVDGSLMVMYLDGLSYNRMAEILGISESNVGVKINRSKKRMAELLKGLIDDF